MKSILYIATVVSITTYLFWEYLPKGSFYIGNALFIFLLCLYIFLTDKNSSIKYILCCLSLNNLTEEVISNNTTLEYNEILFLLFLITIPLVQRNGRKVNKLFKSNHRYHSKVHNTRNNRNIDNTSNSYEKREDNIV